MLRPMKGFYGMGADVQSLITLRETGSGSDASQQALLPSERPGFDYSNQPSLNVAPSNEGFLDKIANMFTGPSAPAQVFDPKTNGVMVNTPKGKMWQYPGDPYYPKAAAQSGVRCPAPNQDLIVPSLDQCPGDHHGWLWYLTQGIKGVTGAAPQALTTYSTIEALKNTPWHPADPAIAARAAAAKMPKTAARPGFPWGETAIALGAIGLVGVTAYAVLGSKGRKRVGVRYARLRRGRRARR